MQGIVALNVASPRICTNTEQGDRPAAVIICSSFAPARGLSEEKDHVRFYASARAGFMGIIIDVLAAQE
jgi:hypothetical protein